MWIAGPVLALLTTSPSAPRRDYNIQLPTTTIVALSIAPCTGTMAQYNPVKLTLHRLFKTFSYYRVNRIVFVHYSCSVFNTTWIHTVPFILDMLMFVTGGGKVWRNKFNPTESHTVVSGKVWCYPISKYEHNNAVTAIHKAQWPYNTVTVFFIICVPLPVCVGHTPNNVGCGSDTNIKP